MKHPSLTTLQDHTFVDSSLGPDSVVIDCGGFHGGFSNAVNRRFGCVCHVLEPSPENFRHIPERLGIIRHPVALSTVDGEAEFHLAYSPICNSLRSLAETAQPLETIRVETVTLPSFLKANGIDRIDLLKLDIEGMEMEVLETLPETVLEKISQITVELHDPFIAPKGADLRRMNRLVHRLDHAGFSLVMPMRPIYFDTLFLNRDALSLSGGAFFRISLQHDHFARVARALRKRLPWLYQEPALPHPAKRP